LKNCPYKTSKNVCVTLKSFKYGESESRKKGLPKCGSVHRLSGREIAGSQKIEKVHSSEIFAG
jgi:hypothetical protein